MTARRTLPKRASRAPLTVSRKELLPANSDDAFRHFVHGLLAFGERVLAVREGFGAAIGLTGIQYTVLVTVAHLEPRQEVSVGAIASHLHLSGAFITTVTNQLEKLEMLRKSRNERDRRVAVLSATPKALQALERLAPLQQQVNDELFGTLTGAQFEQLSAGMEDWIGSGDRAIVLLDYLRRNPPK
jgi:MarR family transcriptional regulator, organic hydroperoxide resistance regulator